MNVSAIVPAAGLGTRMGKAAGKRYGSTRKQFMKVGGTPILALTVRKFLVVDSIREILVAVPEGSEESARAMLPGNWRVRQGSASWPEDATARNPWAAAWTPSRRRPTSSSCMTESVRSSRSGLSRTPFGKRRSTAP